MSRNFPRFALLSAAIVSVVACESTKSANPLSPTVAGPIPGVNISAPKLLEPGSGWEVNADKQPLTLLIENATTNGVRPLSYVFEVATDANFRNKVLTKSGVSQGAGGRTSLRLPSALAANKTYYWHARAEDGANTGAFSPAVSFKLMEPVSIDRPVPISPVNGDQTDTTPVLRFRNAGRSGPVGSITYRVEVSRNTQFTAIAWSGRTGEHSGSDTTINTGTLDAGTTFFWRVRATDPGHDGPWSNTTHFVTSAAAPPSDGGGGGGGGGGGFGGSCASRDGDYIARCISAKYPSYLRAGVSSSTRKANMAFLRDRMIEAAICGGLDVGWNLKRGGPELSIDFVAERTGGTTIGHDIGIDYDNTSRPLRLTWSHWPRGEYKRYPRPSCP
jgi:hypothetical protein